MAQPPSTPQQPIRDPIGWSELIGTVTGAACVSRMARQSTWNGSIGIGCSAFSFLSSAPPEAAAA